MPAVFVHGVPETPAVWDPLIVALGRSDTECLQLPGFGCPLPDGFDPVMETYADWLAAALAAIDEPIDLVSHDWGALLALRVVSTRPDTVRSWVSDYGNLDAAHEWHDMAQVWQTPGDGEAVVDAWIGQSVDERAEGLAGVGVPHHAAVTMSSRMDETMGAAILSLYRSAVTVGADWGPALDGITAPGLLVEAENDSFRQPGRVADLAARIGAELVHLDGVGHWWMLEDPARSAQMIGDFWSRL